MFPLPLVVTIRPSRWLRFTVVALHLTGGLALWLADIPVPARIVGILLLAASLLMYARSGAEATLRGSAYGKLEIRRNDAWNEVHQVSYRLALPLIAILQIQLAGDSRPYHLVVLEDSLSPEDFRRLRVWMEWVGKKPKMRAPA